MSDIIERRSKGNCVICPACNHEFVAVPVDVQEELASLRQQLAEAEERCEASYKVELDLLREMSEELEEVEYLGSHAEGIRVLKMLLAECQAQKNILRDSLQELQPYFDLLPANISVYNAIKAISTIEKSIAVNQLKLNMLHYFIEWCVNKSDTLNEDCQYSVSDGVVLVEDELRRMAKELE